MIISKSDLKCIRSNILQLKMSFSASHYKSEIELRQIRTQPVLVVGQSDMKTKAQ